MPARGRGGICGTDSRDPDHGDTDRLSILSRGNLRQQHGLMEAAVGWRAGGSQTSGRWLRSERRGKGSGGFLMTAEWCWRTVDSRHRRHTTEVSHSATGGQKWKTRSRCPARGLRRQSRAGVRPPSACEITPEHTARVSERALLRHMQMRAGHAMLWRSARRKARGQPRGTP